MADTYDDTAQRSEITDPATNRGSFEAGRTAMRNRWVLRIVGIITLVAGLAALVMPFFGSLSAAIVVGWVLVASGVVGLVTAFKRHQAWEMAAAFAIAVLSIFAGVMMLLQPVVGLLALTTLIIAYLGASGALRIYYGARLWSDGGAWMVAVGALSLLLAVLLFLGLPGNAAIVPGLVLGVDLVLWGVILLSAAIRVGRRSDTSTRGSATRDRAEA